MAELFARVLSNHYRYLTNVVAGLALRCATPRLIAWLLAVADERGVMTDRGTEFELDVSQDVLASVLGTSRQMIAQILLKLERAGVLDAHGKHIVILDRQRLTGMLR